MANHLEDQEPVDRAGATEGTPNEKPQETNENRQTQMELSDPKPASDASVLETPETTGGETVTAVAEMPEAKEPAPGSKGTNGKSAELRPERTAGARPPGSGEG